VKVWKEQVDPNGSVDLTTLDAPRAAADMERWPAQQLLAWAVRVGRATFSTGFGVEGCVLIHLIASERLPIDVFTLDTGLLFPETYTLWRTLEQRYGITIRGVRPAQTVDEQAIAHGPALWKRDPNRCCALRKLEPLEAALEGADLWITAIRRDQTPERATASVIERDTRYGLLKVNPLVGWTSDDVWNFVRDNDVPYNPLHDANYPSIGCLPCTTPASTDEHPRAGRWRGHEKNECGLHQRPDLVRGVPLQLRSSS
jgi:phosphoadenylyl-sulfate reductase (thioredoxin)